MNEININDCINAIIEFLLTQCEKDLEPRPLTRDNYKQYIQEANQLLYNEEDMAFINFLNPDGEFKKIFLDLKDMPLSQEIKEYLNIENGNDFYKRIRLMNNFLIFLELDFNDMAKCGFIDIIFNEASKTVNFRYNSVYEKPSDKLKEKIKKLYKDFDTFICEQYVEFHPDEQEEPPVPDIQTFEKADGASVDDIWAWFNKIYDQNQ